MKKESDHEFYSKSFIKGFVKGTRGTPFVVTFVKSDGTERKMKCKVDLKFKPKPLKEGEVRKKMPKGSVFVLDLKKKEYRSFRADSVIAIE